jgi:hypothetical protein
VLPPGDNDLAPFGETEIFQRKRMVATIYQPLGCHAGVMLAGLDHSGGANCFNHRGMIFAVYCVMGLFSNPDIHIHLHNHESDNSEIMAKLNQLMTKQERFDAILTRIDTVTTDLAGDFATFIKEVKDGTVTDESLARAEAGVAALEALAASKENPVPGEEIPPVTEPDQPQA